MILVADAGGTKTSWRYIDENKSIFQLETGGFNILHQDLRSYLGNIEHELKAFKGAREVHFYVAGFNNSHPGLIENEFHRLFPNAKVNGYSDLLAAARSLNGDEIGWSGILGTGSNMAYFDGQELTIPVRPLGYLLGDEGSGAYIGKRFLAEYLRGRLPEELSEKLELSTSISYKEAIYKTYDDPNPKKYFAGFMTFIHENIKHPYCYQLVNTSFNEHIETFFPGNKPELPVNYTGSVAYFFSDVLRAAANASNISIGLINQSPIAGLALYHKNKIK